MKKTFTTINILAFILLQSVSLNAQSSINKITYNNDGSISMIVFEKSTSKDFIKKEGKSTKNSLNNLLKLSDDIELKLNKTISGVKDFITEYYDSYIDGIIVEGGEYHINYKGNDIISISGRNFSYNEIVSNKELIEEKKAFDLAKRSINAKSYVWENAQNLNNNFKFEKPKGKLVYIPLETQKGNVSLFLVYKFDIFATNPFSRDYIYVDAYTGLILKKNAIIKHSEGFHKKINHGQLEKNQTNNRALKLDGSKKNEQGNADTRYSGRKFIETELEDGSYILRDNTRGVEIHTLDINNKMSLELISEFTDNDNNWTAEEHHNERKNDAALDAHWGITKSYDYFKNTFNRNSYDGKGSPLYSYVHAGDKLVNAFWTGNFMVYGDGNDDFDALTSLDIVAHELGHGICQETANLEYERESGALNESFSDIWAAIIENKYAPEKKAFLMGEDITLGAPNFIRSMSDPKLVSHPDTYRGDFWKPSSIEDGCFIPDGNGNDYCGVHSNSGVLNHWFYILVNGKSGINDIGNSYNVTGIGWESAEQIVYRLETAYLTSKSDYKNARDFGIQATIDLFGEHSPEVIAVQDAFYAVGLGGKYLTSPDIISPTAPTNLVAKDVTGDAVNLSWDSSTDENGIWGYSILQNGVEVYKTPETSLRLKGLTPETSYDFKVKAYDNYNNLSSESNLANITTKNLSKACISSSGNSDIFSIGKVKIGEIDNSSTKITGYEDFAYLNTTLELDTEYTIEITPNIANGYETHHLGYSIFLDKDNTGNFTPDKRIAVINPIGNSPKVTATFKLPEDIILNQPIRLRVIQMYDETTILGCVNFNFGQVEDYSITGKSKTLAVSDLLKGKEIKIYPNPVKEILNVVLNDNKEFKYEVLNIAGDVIKSGSSKGQIDVNYIQPSTYILKVNQNGKIITQKFIKK